MKEKFEYIYKLHSKSVFRLAYSYVFNKCDAEDIVQKSFYKLLHNQKMMNKSDDDIKKWLFKVCSNTAKDLLKSSWKTKNCMLDEEILNNQSFSNNSILNILKAINGDYRIPLFLYYYEGYKIKEIAKILSKSEATIKLRLSKGKEILKSELEDK